MKNVTVPMVSSPVCTHHPPTPIAIAVVTKPASSMTGRYQAEIFTERMWASKRRRLPTWKRADSTSSRPKACTTRTPAMPSWSWERVLPMPSRTSRYAALEARWNFTLASTTKGTQIRHSSSSFQETTASTTTDTPRSRPLLTNMSSPICTSSCSESTSLVIRETITPAFSRS